MLLPSPTARTGTSPLLIPQGSSPWLPPQHSPHTHFTARTGKARQLLVPGQAGHAKRQPGKTGADAVQGKLCVADTLLGLSQTS